MAFDVDPNFTHTDTHTDKIFFHPHSHHSSALVPTHLDHFYGFHIFILLCMLHGKRKMPKFQVSVETWFSGGLGGPLVVLGGPTTYFPFILKPEA